MPKRAALGVAICLLVSPIVPGASAQDRKSADAAIEMMRQVPSISQSDQQRIRDWVAMVVDELASAKPNKREQAGKTLRNAFGAQVNNGKNTDAFRTEFISQTAAVATTHFTDTNVNPTIAMWLARVLLDMNAPEAIPGLLSGLTCKVDAARYLSARGLMLQQSAIAGDANQLATVIQELQKAGLSETNPVVLSRIYGALAIPQQGAAVLDAYLAIFDKRLTTRRASNTVDGAELEAFLYFSKSETMGTLNAAQKSQLAAKIAVFLRLDAARYNDPVLDFRDADKLERLLVEAESIFIQAGAKPGGDIAGLLSAQGRGGMDQVSAEAAKWIGDAASNTKGSLNDAPWSVAVGAP